MFPGTPWRTYILCNFGNPWTHTYPSVTDLQHTVSISKALGHSGAGQPFELSPICLYTGREKDLCPAELVTLGLKAQLNKAPRSWASVSDFPVSVAKRMVTLTRDAMVLRISMEAKSTAL